MNNSAQVNEKGVIERMHITLQCWIVLESLSLKSFPTHSLCLYLVFMLVKAENPLSHRYVVAKGISVSTDFPRLLILNSVFHRTACCNIDEAV